MKVPFTCLALGVGLALGCADEAVEARDYGSDCFIRGTFELGDGAEAVVGIRELVFGCESP